MCVVSYLRVSTDLQDVEHQRRSILKFAEENGINVDAEFTDVISGAVDTTEREGFNKMIEHLKQCGEPKIVLVYELSRISRNMRDLLRTLDKLENEIGAYVISVSPTERALATMDPNIRQLIRALIGMFAELERQMISQRTKSGMSKSKRVLETAEKVSKYADKVLELKNAGKGVKQIASELGISEYVVRKILANRGIGVSEDVCPQCFHKMKRVRQEVTLKPLKTYIIYRCPNCGYQKIIEVMH
ncbi:MAG: recombinase family protein [Thermoproteus sp.]|nr:recombinase family protein [Thermoproteus sp.]